MSLVRLLDNVTVVTKNGTKVSITTDAYPLGGQTQAVVMPHVEVLDSTGGAVNLDINCEASNDGSHYAAYGALDQLALAVGTSWVIGPAPFAFIRFEIELDLQGGAAGDTAWATLDLHVNFTHT